MLVGGAEQIDVLETLDPANVPPTLEATALSITSVELDFLDQLDDLVIFDVAGNGCNRLDNVRVI